jgi:hypothetical protein
MFRSNGARHCEFGVPCASAGFAQPVEQKVQRSTFGFATLGHEFRKPLNALKVS